MIQKTSVIIFAIFLLSSCRTVVDESAIDEEPGMDDGVRQIMMEEEYEAPQEEEGLIPAPSDMMRWD